MLGNPLCHNVPGEVGEANSASPQPKVYAREAIDATIDTNRGAERRRRFSSTRLVRPPGRERRRD